MGQAVTAKLESSATEFSDEQKRYLEGFMSGIQIGRLGPRAVIHRLCAHGLSREEASRALAEAQSALGITPLDSARGLLQRKGLFGRALPAKEMARAERMLRTRGFTESTIEAVLGSPLDPELQGG